MKRLGAAMALGALLAACDDDPEFPFAIYSGEWNGDDALLVGTLTRDGNCLNIENASARERITIAFASDVSWDEDTETVRWTTHAVRVGDTARVGGSAHSPDAIDWIRPPDPGCATPSVWLVGD